MAIISPRLMLPIATVEIIIKRFLFCQLLQDHAMPRFSSLLLVAFAIGVASSVPTAFLLGQQPCAACIPTAFDSNQHNTWKQRFGGPPPRCGPVLEDALHWNLYWFNCASRVENCDDILPALMSHTPSWYAAAEFVPLLRDADGSRTFATFGADAPADLVGTAALGTSGFRTEFAGGGKFLLGRQLGEWYRVEVAYLGAYEYDDTAAVRNNTANSEGGTGTFTSPFSDFGMPETPGVDFNHLVQIGLESEFNSVEFHLRRKIVLPTPGVEASFLLGGRYMQLDEQFAYRAEASVPTPMGVINEVSVTTQNHLIGMQIGMLLQFYQTSRAWIDLEFKGGIFENMSEQATAYNNTDSAGTVTSFTGSEEQMRTSFAGELLLAANYNFSRTLTLKLGYQATALTGVALAADNFQENRSVLTMGPADLRHDGDIVYHGPVIGLTWVR